MILSFAILGSKTIVSFSFINLFPGPTFAMRCSTSFTYGIYNEDGDSADGEITKFDAKHEDFPINMSHEDFLVRFPEDANEKEKMLILGAAFMLNFMYFEIT